MDDYFRKNCVQISDLTSSKQRAEALSNKLGCTKTTLIKYKEAPYVFHHLMIYNMQLKQHHKITHQLVT
jgi:hypothetical protein